MVVLASAPLAAQATAGIGDDAIPVNRGTVRMHLVGQWNDWESTFGDSAGSSRRRLLSRFNRASLDGTVLPQLVPVDLALRDLTGISGLAVTLGTLAAQGDVRQSTAPIAVDVGITDRLALGLVVPYVESRDNSQLLLNRAGGSANVGRNPAFGTGGAAARAANAALLRQIAAARSQLSAELARCANASEPDCAGVRGNEQAAAALLSRARTAQEAIVVVYGDSVRGGSPVVPITGTGIAAAVASTVAALRTGFAAFGVSTIPADAAPQPAVSVYGPGAIETIARDSAFGLSYTRLGNTRRSGIGDIDLTATYLLFDTFAASPRARLTTRARAFRAAVSLGWRFGVAAADDPTNPFDVAIGDGANALLARATADVVLGRRLWASVTTRFVQPFADRLTMALPLATISDPFVNSGYASAERTLGRRIELELAPRVNLTEFFGLSAAYSVRRRGSDEYRVAESAAQSGGALSTAPQVLHAAGFGITFSTLSSYTRGRSRLPVEVIYSHWEAVTGSGGQPAVRTDRLELRAYTGFPRR